MTDLASWVGRERITSEVLDTAQLTKMAATMDRPLAFNAGDKLPAGWHWLFFNQLEAQARLGPDGHPKRGERGPRSTQQQRLVAHGAAPTHHK